MLGKSIGRKEMNASSLEQQLHNTACHSRQWLARTLLIVAICIGVPGNLLICAVLCRKSSGFPASARIYYVCMAVMDTLQLSTQHLMEFIDMATTHFTSLWWLASANTTTCRLVRFLWYTTESASNWTLVLYCLERVLVVLFPLKAKRLVSARKASAAVSIVGACSCAIAYVMTDAFQTVSFGFFTICTTIKSRFSLPEWLYFASTILTTWVPVALEIFCVAALLHCVRLAMKANSRLIGVQQRASSTSRALLTLVGVALVHLACHAQNAAIGVLLSLVPFSDFASSLTMLCTYYMSFYVLVVPRCINFAVLVVQTKKFKNELLCLLNLQFNQQ